MAADYDLARPAKGGIDKRGSTLWFGAPPIFNPVCSPLMGVGVGTATPQLGKVNDFCLNGTCLPAISAIVSDAVLGLGAGSLVFKHF